MRRSTAGARARDRRGSIVGSRPVHSELERALAGMEEERARGLFPTGFAANLGVLTTFGGPGTSS